MQFISFIRFDVIALIVFLGTVILGLIRNQTKCWLRTISFILAFALVGCFFVFNWFNLPVLGLKFLDEYVFTPVCNFMKLGEGYKIVLGILVFFLAVFLFELIFAGILKLLGLDGHYKYKKYPSYATTHKPVVGLISGLIRGLVNVYVVYMVFYALVVAKGITVEGDYLFNLIQKIDPFMVNILG